MQKILFDILILIGVGIGILSITAQIAHSLFSGVSFDSLSWKVKMAMAVVVALIFSIFEWYTYTLL